MIQNNKLEKSFGPIGTFAGIILFLAGLVISFANLSGLFLVILGSFVGFSQSGTLIDFEKRRVKLYNKLFGLIPTGQWVSVQDDMKIGIKKSNEVWRAYSRSNRSIAVEGGGYILFLVDQNGKEIMPLGRYPLEEIALADLASIGKQLKIEVK